MSTVIISLLCLVIDSLDMQRLAYIKFLNSAISIIELQI